MKQLARKAVFPVGILFGLGLFALAGVFGQTDDGPRVAAEGLEAVFPGDGASVTRQDVIVADLGAGFAGTLRVNDIAIPLNQLEPDDGLNRLAYRPGPGKVVPELRARENCAEVVYWRVDLGPAAAAPAYRWCFDAL